MSTDLVLWTSTQNISGPLLAQLLDKAASEYNANSEYSFTRINSVKVRQFSNFNLESFEQIFFHLVNPTVNVFDAASDYFIDRNRIGGLPILLLKLIQLHQGTRHCLLLLRVEPKEFLGSEQKVLFNLGRDLYEAWIEKVIVTCKETVNSRYFGIGWLDKTPVAPPLELILDHDRNQLQTLAVKEYFNFLDWIVMKSSQLAKTNTLAGASSSIPKLNMIPFFDDFSKTIYFQTSKAIINKNPPSNVKINKPKIQKIEKLGKTGKRRDNIPKRC